jgi:hypothetical protein
LLLRVAVEAAITAVEEEELVDLEQTLHSHLPFKHIPLPLALVARLLRARQGGKMVAIQPLVLLLRLEVEVEVHGMDHKVQVQMVVPEAGVEE